MENTNGIGSGTEVNNSQPVITSSPAEPVQSTPAPAQSNDERSFRQSEVNDIVRRAKNDAVDTYRRQQTEQPQYVQQKYGDNVNQQQNQHMQQQNANSSDDHYRKIAAEEAQRLRDQWLQEAKSRSEAEYAQGVVQSFHQKISPGREKYQDFDQVVGDTKSYASFPNVVQILAQHVDNAHDMMYELAKDKGKLAQLELMAREFPDTAIEQARRISQSLKDNEAASKTRIPNAPLSQMRPSNTGTDNGVMSVKDYRSKYKV